MKQIRDGILRGLGVLLVLGTAVFAFNVTGTIKTWSSGETLTAVDLNTTVQSLKTAVEGATQLVEMHNIEGETGNTITLGNGVRYGGLTGNLRFVDKYATTMTRSGTVRSASVTVRGNLGMTASQSCSITLQKNEVDTNLSISVPGTASSGVFSDSDNVAYEVGDKLNWVSSCGPYNGTVWSFTLPIILKFEF